ncbi:MAG: tyrosine-type recombinase/integrase [Candidatus Micrarchaeia archaeon]|jgi:integrase
MGALEQLIELKKRTVGDVRIYKYLTYGKMLQRLSPEKLDVSLKDMKKTVALADKINRSHYAAWTKKDLRLQLKLMWKLANGYDLEDTPKEIRWVKCSLARRDRKLPKNLFTDEEIKKMLKVANLRNRAIISLLYESGLRNSELCALKKNDVEFIKEGARIHVPEGTKTGSRSILIIDSEPLLASWLASHPIKKDDAPLFVSIHSKKIKPMCKENIIKLLKLTAIDAGITHRVYPHLLRHSSATKLAKHLTEAQMKAYFGWGQDSSMAATYVHLSGKDTDAGILTMHNKPVEKEKAENKLEPQICKRCGKTNMHDVKMCGYCGLSFDKNEAKSDNLSMQEEMAKMRKQIKQLLDAQVDEKKKKRG